MLYRPVNGFSHSFIVLTLFLIILRPRFQNKLCGIGSILYCLWKMLLFGVIIWWWSLYKTILKHIFVKFLFCKKSSKIGSFKKNVSPPEKKTKNKKQKNKKTKTKNKEKGEHETLWNIKKLNWFFWKKNIKDLLILQKIIITK